MYLSACLRILPVVLLLAITFFSYYIYVTNWKLLRSSATPRAFKLLFFHFFFLLMIWSYFATMCTETARVKPPYILSQNLVDQVNSAKSEAAVNDILANYCNVQGIRLWTRTESGFIRYCWKCKHIKPDRCHHCSNCKTCLLKMDHHCPWMNTCICFSNYKMFILCTLYCSLYCFYYAGTTLADVTDFFTSSNHSLYEINLIFIFFFVVINGFLSFFLFFYHLRLLLNNMTTLEYIDDNYFIYREPLTFNISLRYNFREVFGERWSLWLLPVPSSLGNGIHFFTSFKDGKPHSES